MNSKKNKILLVVCIISVFSLVGCNNIKQTDESQKADLEEVQEIQENDSNKEEQEQVQDYKQPHNNNTEDDTKPQEKVALANILQEESNGGFYPVYSNTYDYEVDGEIKYSVPYFEILGLNDMDLEKK